MVQQPIPQDPESSEPAISSDLVEETSSLASGPSGSCGSDPWEIASRKDGEAEDEQAGPDPDAEVVSHALGGDTRAFEELVVRHQARIYTHVNFMVRDPELAADLAQECFLRAWRGLASFRGEARFATWLKRIAVNVTLHHFERTRAQKRTARVVSISSPGLTGDPDGAGDFEIPDERQPPERSAIDHERQAAIERAVSELEPEYRTALALRELHGYSYQEITEVLGMPIGTVKSKIFRARQVLQEKLKDYL
ncbi:MAG: sigma-70 family RNA polymerase sigma factor [Planctomycetota bacterium]